MRHERKYYDYIEYDQIRVRVRFTTERGIVLEFVVQLEVFHEAKWKPVVRYDTAHSFAHKDSLTIKGDVVKTELNMKYNEALTFGMQDVYENWKEYVDRFLKGG